MRILPPVPRLCTICAAHPFDSPSCRWISLLLRLQVPMQRPEQRLPLPGTALGRLYLQNSSNTSRGRRNCFNIEKASSLRFASGLSGWMAHFKRTLRILSSRATPECPRHLRSRPCQESCESRGPRQSPAGRMLEHLYILVINVWQPLREATVASTSARCQAARPMPYVRRTSLSVFRVTRQRTMMVTMPGWCVSRFCTSTG